VYIVYNHVKKKAHPIEFYGFMYQEDIIKKSSGPWQVLKLGKNNLRRQQPMTYFTYCISPCHYLFSKTLGLKW